MYEVIRDFLLVPALLTTGLLALPAVLVGLLARRLAAAAGAAPRGTSALALAVGLGLVHTLGAILVMFALSVLRDQEALQTWTWPVAMLGWLVAFLAVARLRLAGLWAALLVTTLAWGLDTWVTAAILFE